MGKVVIGVDPHKRINAVCVVAGRGRVVASEQFDNSAAGFRELKKFWRQWQQRSWAVEGANGVGKHLAQRLVAEGETVFDVSTRRAALARVHAGGNGRKTDDTDAESIAMVGLRTSGLAEVRPDALTVELKLLANSARQSGARRRPCRAQSSASVTSAGRSGAAMPMGSSPKPLRHGQEPARPSTSAPMSTSRQVSHSQRSSTTIEASAP